MSDSDLERAKEVEAIGRDRYGAVDWERLLARLEIAPEAMRHVLMRPDAADVLAAMGRDHLLQLAESGDEAAGNSYRLYRLAQRENYRSRKHG